MPSTTALFALLALLPVALSTGPIGPNPNSKRGLLYVPNSAFPDDDKIWIQAGSPLTWYYNYQTLPSANLEGGATALQFVPMLWGDYSNTFVSDVKSLITKGYNITTVLGFNEPDGGSATGGSNITPAKAAARWKSDIQPLAALGIKLGAPAPTGAPSGLTWMNSFFAACTGCTFDFIPLHWYGNFDGLASHIGTYQAAFPNTTLWITEFALNDATVSDTQYFFNTSIEYFDRLDYVGRYTYFGAFRSACSNVGVNAAMLDQNGGLTYEGAWYLNQNESTATSVVGTTGRCPTSSSSGSGTKGSGVRDAHVAWFTIFSTFVGIMGAFVVL